jgi:hypothetical protein
VAACCWPGQRAFVPAQVGLRDDPNQPVALLHDHQPVQLVLGQQPAGLVGVLVGPDRDQVLGGDVAHPQCARVLAGRDHPGDDVAVGARPPSTTGSGPFSFWIISLAASTTLIDGEAVAGSEVMTSRTLGILLTPFDRT